MNPKNSRRKPIEIYFILYLAALMLLIPDLKQKDKSSQSDSVVSENIFRIFPEKNILTTRISFDSLGKSVIQTDSVNYIYYSGDVKNVTYEFQVINKQLNQYITINSKDNSFNFFRYYQLPELKAVIFVWQPPIIDRRNYVLDVKVMAIGTRINKDNSETQVKSTTQFSLVVSYIDNQTGLPFTIVSSDSAGSGRRDTVYQQNSFGYSELFIDFQYRKVRSLINDDWENKVIIYGVNLLNDLKRKPEIWINNKPENNNGSVFIKQITNNSITLGGKTPQFGSSRVKIKLTRRTDGNSIEDEFTLEPLPITQPIFSSVIYPNQQYTINPNFPDLENKTYSVRVFSENRTIYSSNSNNSFFLTVDDGLINKSVFLERTINGNLYGQTYQIQVKSYPIPNITKIQSIGTNRVRVIVNSFGIYSGKENYIKSVEIDGNGVYKELVGQTVTNRKDLTYTQVYEIIPHIDNKPFEFKLRVQDNRGAWSNWEKYPN